uniref:Ctr_SF3_1 conopeptide n=1 Tax=Conus tribblei TaxID=101761 RepID=A0A0K8TUG0_CONTD
MEALTIFRLCLLVALTTSVVVSAPLNDKVSDQNGECPVGGGRNPFVLCMRACLTTSTPYLCEHEYCKNCRGRYAGLGHS